MALNRRENIPQFDDIVKAFQNDFLNPQGMMRLYNNFRNGKNNDFVPSCNILITKNIYSYEFDLPGMSRENIKINVKDNQLIVDGERKVEHVEDNECYYQKESSHGTFTRTFKLPRDVIKNTVKAKHENGVLKVSFDRIQESEEDNIIPVNIE